MITVLNKIDRLSDSAVPELLAGTLSDARMVIPISAETGEGLDTLLCRVSEVLEERRSLVDVELMIPFAEAKMLDLPSSRWGSEDQRFNEHGTEVTGRIPERLLPQI